MHVRAGTPCTITHGGSRGPIYDTVITRQPAHGVARVEGTHRVTYLGDRNYSGWDGFVYTRRGLDVTNHPLVRVLRVRVYVQPAIGARQRPRQR
jgi:hypothetical protein